jgi:multidrug efflux pump subunit AcrA (membrane-fusion protein)
VTALERSQQSEPSTSVEAVGSVPVGAPAAASSVPDDGRRRRIMALAVVGAAIISATGGAVIGSRLKSPADAAQDRAAPVASRITVPVERQALSSSITLAGEIQFAEPTPIKLAGAVGIPSGDTAVVTRAPEIDQQVNEGDVMFDISGRPVFVVQGSLPAYRSLAPGTTGPDVQQLEESLLRLGYNPGPVDTVYDGYTSAALDAMYADAGYRSVGPTDEETDRLRQLRTAVTDAEESVRQADVDLVAAGQTTTGSQLLSLQQASAQAGDAVPRSLTQAATNNTAAAQAVTTATVARDAATVARDAAKAFLDAALVPGAINPDTGEQYESEEIALRRGAMAEAELSLADRSTALAEAQAQQTAIAAQGEADIRSARDAKALADAQLTEALKAPDTTAAQRARDDAAAALVQAQADYDSALALSGTRLPAGEMVFVPTLPSTITEVAVVAGGPAADVLATVSSSETQVLGRVSRADSGLVKEGATVDIELRDFDLVFQGTVTYVGQPQSTGEADDSSGSGRLQVIVEPSDPVAIREYVFASARIIVDVASTGDEVLVVPVAAVSLGADGQSRVEVERAPVTDDDGGLTETVEVEVGLTADGLVEVRPTSGALDEGDRVVVGNEAPVEQTDDEPAIDEAPAEAPADEAPAGTDAAAG